MREPVRERDNKRHTEEEIKKMGTDRERERACISVCVCTCVWGGHHVLLRVDVGVCTYI